MLRKLYRLRYRARKRKNIRKIIYILSKDYITNVYFNKFKGLTNILSNNLKKNVQIELIRLHYPYKNSNILANILALLVNKIKFIKLTRKLLKFSIIKKYDNKLLRKIDNVIPSYLTGLKIKIGGRLMKYRVVRKRTVKFFQRGASSPGKVNFND